MVCSLPDVEFPPPPMSKPDGEKMDADAFRREATEWLIRLSSGEATPGDFEDLRLWCRRSPSHAEAFARAQALWQALGPAGALYLDRNGAAAVHLPAAPPRRGGLSRRGLLAGALATAAAVPLALRPPWQLWPSLGELGADYRTGIGEQRRIELADGAAVELNTATAVNLAPPGAGDRLELLAGEAAVTTPPGRSRPVVVRVAGGEVSARVASFTLRQEGGLVRVTCLDGAVAVRCGAAAGQMGPGQQVELSQGRLGPVVAVDAAEVTAWRQRMLVFHDEPLARVIDEVNRYRPGRIVLLRPDLAGRQVSARFKLDRLDDVVLQISQVFALEPRTLPGGIVFLS